MPLQAVVDDSGKGGDVVFILAGFVLTAEEWVAFADRWQEILDLHPKIDYFKMSEAWHFTGQFAKFKSDLVERDKRLQQFISLILSFDPLAVRNVIPIPEYRKQFKGKIAKQMDYPYFLSFYGVIAALQQYQVRKQWHPTEAVDFIFDEQGKEPIAPHKAFEYGMDIAPPQVRSLMGERPVHRDEKTFLPLQAADLFAWHSHRYYLEKSRGRSHDDPAWKTLSALKCAEDIWTEQRLKKIADGVRASGLIFDYDLNVLPPKEQKKWRKAMKKSLP